MDYENYFLKRCFSSSKEEITEAINYVIDGYSNLKGVDSRQQVEYLNGILDFNETTEVSEGTFLSVYPEWTIPLANVNDEVAKKSTLMQWAKEWVHHLQDKEIDQDIFRLTQDRSNVEEVLQKVRAFNQSKENSTNHLKPTLDRVLKNRSNDSLISVGIGEIDKLADFRYGEITTVMGFTGQGKSLLANNIGYVNFSRNKLNVVILSLEISEEDTLTNLIIRHGYEMGIPISKQDFKDAEKIREVVEDFDSRPNKLYIVGEESLGNLTQADIINKLEQVDDDLIAQTGRGIDIVIVDHIGIMAYSNKEKNTTDGNVIDRYVTMFRHIVKSFRKDADGNMRKLHIILVAQTNREGKQRADRNKGVYDLRAISDSHEVERASSLVISIWSDANTMSAHHCRVCLLKNRNGGITPEYLDVDFYPERYFCGENYQEIYIPQPEEQDFDMYLSNDDFGGFGGI